jgi:hypothetical protein
VANYIFFHFKENRQKLLGHKIAPAAHKIPAPPWDVSKVVEKS